MRMRSACLLHVGAMALVLASAGASAHGRSHHNHSRAHMKLHNAQIEPASFAALRGWAHDDHAAAFAAFLNSCKAILNSTRAIRAGRPIYAGLYNVCKRADAAAPLNRAQARAFFEANFEPVRVAPLNEAQGFFTGYYEAEFAGSRYPSDEYTVPLYRVPRKDIGKSRVFNKLDRSEIEDGAIAGRGLEICYVKDPIDAFFAQIQGSARIKLENGKLLRLNYIASNGKPYTPVGRFLIERGIVSREDMSMDRIREWMEANPEEGKELRRKNRSFVFFEETDLGPHDECIGAQGVPLTAERSIAVDNSQHVYGTPIWVEADLPIASEKPETPFHHLMVAQDTGSAIVGPARADIYFGHGVDAPHIAGRIKQYGNFYMLVPKSVRIERNVKTPIPRPKPTNLIVSQAATAAGDKEASAAPLPRPRMQP
jgi:membrane-bound lytic murein transglycosylase A